MSIGLMLFIFVVALILVSISPIEKWRLAANEPLDVDDLQWPAAGYGSATISLNCLFGAYAAMLLLIGYTCFAGVVAGVVGGLFTIQWWISKYQSRIESPGFQSILYNLKIFESSAADHAFWILVAFCQLGLAVAELVLLHHVFAVGLGFSEAYAIVASLAAACVAYYYCLFGGYQAVFRADALQYVFILIMGLVMLLLLWKEAPALTGLDTIFVNVRKASRPAKILMAGYPHLRILFEFLGGLALGIMPVLAAPDAWKRVLIISRRYQHPLRRPDRFRLLGGIIAALRLAPLRLLVATALPLAMILPLFMRFSSGGVRENWAFPIRELFAISSPIGGGFILLGMLAAFMSTFAGALLSATHVLMGQNVFPGMTRSSGIARFRVIFGFGFTLAFLLLIPLVSWLPNPYAPGAILVAPFALVSGLLTGTSFGARRATGAMIYVLSPVILGWVFFALRYMTSPGNAADPYVAAPLVFFGCCVFFLVACCSRIFSRRTSDNPNSQGGVTA